MINVVYILLFYATSIYANSNPFNIEKDFQQIDKNQINLFSTLKKTTPKHTNKQSVVTPPINIHKDKNITQQKEAYKRLEKLKQAQVKREAQRRKQEKIKEEKIRDLFHQKLEEQKRIYAKKNKNNKKYQDAIKEVNKEN